MTRQVVDKFELTRDQHLEFTARTKSHLSNTLQLLSLGQQQQHQLGTKVHDKMGLRAYTDGDSTTITGHLATTMMDLEYAVYATTTKQVQTVAAILHSQQYDDAGLLDLQQSHTIEDPFQFVGVKYVALARKGMFAKPHQIVYLEATGTLHEDGVARLYQMVEYVDLVHVYTAKATWSQAIRPVCSTLTLFEADPNDIKSVRVFSRARYSKDTPSPLHQMHQPPAYWEYVLSLASLAVSRRLVDATSLVQHWVPNSSCKTCSVCDAGFKALRPKHHCRSCGEMMCHACSIPIQSPTVMHKYCTKCVLRSRELRGNDKVELPRKQSVRRPVPSASSSSSHDGEFLKSIRETTKHLNTPSPSPSPHQQQQHVLTPPPPVEQKQLKALEKITDSIAHQESLIVSMREALDRQKRFAAASNSITSTTGTADSYTADELLDTLPSEQHRFEYLDT